MPTVTVTASGRYDIQIGSGVLQQLGEAAAAVLPGRTAALVSDDTVFSLYGKQAAAQLEQAGFTVHSFVFPHGEGSKNGETYLRLLTFLAEHHLTRADGIVALGGGVTGDLAGFAAATYLRGIRYLQIPTTLLAMVDSSVGGKTAIDLPQGKNLCGAFHQPALVLCDPDLLATLPRRTLLDGCAEVIKYGMLADKELFYRVDGGPDYQDWTAVITDCVTMKRDIVQADEFDTGVRRCLNLGHTFGHAIERSSQYTVSHGQAVAIGMAMMTRAASRMGFCTREPVLRLQEVLGTYELPAYPSCSAETLLSAAQDDKKRQDTQLTLVVPTGVGSHVLHTIPMTELPRWIEAGMA